MSGEQLQAAGVGWGTGGELGSGREQLERQAEKLDLDPEVKEARGGMRAGESVR